VLVGTGEGAGAGVVLEAGVDDVELICDISGRDGERSDEVVRLGEASGRDESDDGSSSRGRFLDGEALETSLSGRCRSAF
jgi:hypothetical protein